jgi:hypothetical protein
VTREILGALSVGVRQALARDLGLADASVDSIAGYLASPARVRAVLAQLTPVERDALIALVLAGGNGGREAVQARLGMLHPSERRQPQALRGLERRGLLAPAVGFGWQAILYDVVEDAAAAAVMDWMLKACPQQPGPGPAVPIASADPAVVVGDLARLLGAIDPGTRVTKAGDLRKADARRLAQALDRGQASLVPAGSPLRGEHDAPVHLAFALLVQLGLLTESGGQMRPSEDGARWIEMHAAAQWKAIVSAWRDIGMWHLGPAMPILIACCARGGWVDSDRLIDLVGRYMPDLDWDDESGHREALHSLFLDAGLAVGALGVATVGGRRLVRVRSEALAAFTGQPVAVPDMDEPLVVQPDFEVVVPQRAPARVHRDLERWAERIRVDRVGRYRLTRASVGRCSRSGEPVADWLGRLAAAAKFGVPDNVGTMVREWAEAVCRVEMWPAVVIRFDPAPPPDWTPPTGARRLADAVWSVDFGEAPSVLRELAGRGVPAAGEPDVWRGLAKVGKAAEAMARSRPFLDWPCPPPQAPVTEFADELPARGRSPDPEPEAVVPALAPSGPAMPRREIRRALERAAAAGRVVEITTLDGDRCAIVPHLAQDRVTGICVECGGTVDLPVAEIHSLLVRRKAAR